MENFGNNCRKQLSLVLFIVLTIRLSTINSEATDQLKFDRPHETVSVVVGKRALLPCYVSIQDVNNELRTNNGQSPFKVIWMKLNNSSILTMEDRAINGDPRITLLHAYADEWNLQIDDIDEDDAGIYRCVINTGIYKTVALEVKVPPKIIDESTTEPYPAPIKSGSNFTIKCYAHGKPMPKIRILSYDQSDNAQIISDRNEITLVNVSRHTRRRYECIASNGYPPDVARSFQLTIQYAPELTLVHHLPSTGEERSSSLLIVDYQLKEIRLKCRVVMNPFDKIYWLKNTMKLMNNHRVHQYVSTHMEHYIVSELVIKDFSVDDQGEYSCFTSNFLGRNSKTIQVIIAPSSSSSSSTNSMLVSTITPTTTTMSTTTISGNYENDFSTSHFVIARRKRPKHSRTTAHPQHAIHRSTELLREMTISSSSSSSSSNVIKSNNWMMLMTSIGFLRILLSQSANLF